MNWIKRFDKLPEENKWVLIVNNNLRSTPNIQSAKMSKFPDGDYRWYTLNNNRLLLPCEVTHWCEIEMPNEEKEE